jgi:DNA-binding transcriptional ArsR family regulator
VRSSRAGRKQKKPTSFDALAAALSHPLRVRILYGMKSPDRIYSPSEFERAINEDSTEPIDVKRIAYHFRELRDLGFIEEVRVKPVRGSVEHFYRPAQELGAWQEEWVRMPESVKQALASTVLVTGVEAAGAAIDSGAFGARDDSVLAQDTFWTDERGALQALAVLARAMEDLMQIAEESETRLEENGEDDRKLLTFVIAGFEGALRPV